MADILIKGLKLPEKANELRLIIHPNGQVLIVKQTYWEETEAIEIPDHGRLIDADVLMVEFEKAENSCDQHGREFSYSFRSAGELCTEWWPLHHMLQDAPTVIPAEPPKEET